MISSRDPFLFANSPCLNIRAGYGRWINGKPFILTIDRYMEIYETLISHNPNLIFCGSLE